MKYTAWFIIETAQISLIIRREAEVKTIGSNLVKLNSTLFINSKRKSTNKARSFSLKNEEI